MMRTLCVTLLSLTLLTAVADAGVKTGLKVGTPDLKSAGPLAFGPDGILFVGDSQSAAVFAIATGDTKGDASKVTLNIEGIDKKIAGKLGTESSGIRINDLAINPATGNAFMSISRRQGRESQPVLVRVNAKGDVAVISLKKIAFAKATLPNAPAPGGTGRRNKRSQSITDLAFVDGRVFVAGLSNEEFASTLRSIPFPFSDSNRGTGARIFHGAHGRFETNSPVRTFTHFKIDGKSHLLAAYTCTPLVKFPVSELKAGANIEGTTIAELGNRNRPLDMFVYEKSGKAYILMANSSRGMMKITTDKIGSMKGITERVSSGKTAGLTYDKLPYLKGVVQLDRLNKDNAVLLIQTDSGSSNLKTIALP
jgi:hypothetical protein